MQKILYFFLLMTALIPCAYGQNSKLDYPETRKDNSVTDNYFGTQVADPFRWLEDDRSDETMEWVQQQNQLTFSYLDNIPFRSQMLERLTEMWNYPKQSAPFHHAPYYFVYKNDGLQNQSVLYYSKTVDGEQEVLLDPNTFSEDGTASLSGFSVSKDGMYAAYSISRGGSDWNTIQVMRLDTREVLTDQIEWVKFSGISWWKNGFFYSRFPEPEEGTELMLANQNQAVYYHTLGTAQAEDKLVYVDTENPLLGAYGGVTEDEDFLILSISQGTYGNKIKVKDLTQGLDSEFITIIDDFNNESSILESNDGKLYLFTNIGAPTNRVVQVDPENPARENWKDVIAQQPEVLSGASLVNGKWYATYLKDASSLIRAYDKQGKYLYDIALPGLGNAGGFGASKKEKEIYYTFNSFNYPTTVFKYDTEKNTSTVFSTPDITFNPQDFEVSEVFYPSTDGQKVHMFLVHKKGLVKDGNTPTLLYGYGGFDIPLQPGFSVSNMLFLEQGGIYAVANIRGGGEYGETWHKGGMLLNKQQVFDDFIAAAEYLIAENYTSSSKLAIHGRSNGGLLVGACMTQRPDLFQVAIPGVGVLDMLRYHKFTIGHAWAVEYGSSDTREHFENLYTYSPLHKLKKDEKYPATLVLTADHDDRVVPAHSFKFAATLQDCQAGSAPTLIRIDVNAGHGAGKSTQMLIQEAADFWAFLFYNMNLTYKKP